VRPAQQAVVSTRVHIQEAQSAAKRVSDETKEECKTKEWQAAYDSLNKELTDAYTQVSIANEKLDQVQPQIESLAKAANAERDSKMRAQADLQKVVPKYHRAKGILALLAAGLVAFLLINFKWVLALVPPPWNIVATIAAPALAATAVFVFL
jgi:chromosome segregation ATPase